MHRQEGTAMMDFNVAIRATLLLVDDDIYQLKLRSLVLKMFGFTVVTAASPIEALSLLAQPPGRKVNVVILDYEMPTMNGCVLADYLKAPLSRPEDHPAFRSCWHSGERNEQC
jgi:CheY-like chemotaxis protein